MCKILITWMERVYTLDCGSSRETLKFSKTYFGYLLLLKYFKIKYIEKM
jgi:hypothetical protein